MATQYRVIGEERKESAKKVVEEYNLDANRIKEFSARKESYFEIDRGSLVADTALNFNLIIKRGMDFEVLVRADSRSPFFINSELLDRIRRETGSEIMIEKSDMPLYKEYLSSLMASSGTTEGDKLQRNTIALKENSKILMKELLEDPRSGQRIKEVKKAVSSITDLLLENKEMIHTMLSLSKYDYYTYTHCVNVATMSIGLGVAIGLNKEQVGHLGIGAMLHDIGKSSIPAEILNKQGKLDEFEFRWIQEHVKEGEKILHETLDFPAEAFDAAVQHHEKLSGKGYPYGLKGREITLFGRICAIADCYDALTTQRPYKRAFTPFEALKIIVKETEHYDVELLQKFVRMLGKLNQ